MQGLRCDQCKAGYFDHPRCSDCGCNRLGATGEVCDTQNAKCLCKENVDGDRCDYCKQGMFNLEERNPKGCTQCYCFGVTNVCITSDLFFGVERNLNADEWKLAYATKNSNESDVSIKIGDSDNSDAIQFNLDSLAENVDLKLSEPIYWSAPANYLGNKVTSYGGAIRYSIQISAPENTKGSISTAS